ncbi:MAG: glycosyl transferase group 1 [Sporomusa sp.]|nr:glycosyl transferase group 1 [Sporomusa sp.]
MKIAYCTTDLSTSNGWGRYSYEILRRLPSYGIEPVILSTNRIHESQGLSFQPVLSSASGSWTKGFKVLQDWWSNRNLINDCSIVHALTEPVAPASMLLGSGKKLVLSLHGTYSVTTLHSGWGWLFREAYDKADIIFTVSNYTSSQVLQHLPHLSAKLFAVPLGVETNHIAASAIPSADKREPAFLTVGQVKARKGALEIVQALGRVVERFPAAHLYIVGDMSDKKYISQVKEKIEELGLQRSVIWTGRISDAELGEYYKKVRGLVMASRNVRSNFEGFGLVHLEANAYGVPAIGSLDCGNEDAIKDGYSGYLIPQGNIHSLSEAMIKLLCPAEEWDLISNNARRFAEEMSWDRLVEAYVRRYDGL